MGSDAVNMLVGTNGAPVVLTDCRSARTDFPILQQEIHGHPLVFLDTAASAQKPQQVIDAIANLYSRDYANIHRGVHDLSMRSTVHYEGAREKVRTFIGAKESREIVFVRGATEGINLVAQSLGQTGLVGGDEVLITEMEHHANIVPWQVVCQQTGAILKVAPVDDRGELQVQQFTELLGSRTKIVSFTHLSNVTGVVNPVKMLVDLAHSYGALVLVDGSQAVPHLPVNVEELGCDFYVFSGHKAYGPSGVGVLYGKADVLEKLPPYQTGGDMIESVSFEASTYAEIPRRFEAGTPHIAGAVGLAAALDYLSGFGMAAIYEHGRALTQQAARELANLPGVSILGDPTERLAVVSFNIEGAHPHDVGTVLDQLGIAVRVGHHCAQPLTNRLGFGSSVRASFGIYNCSADINALVVGLGRVRELFSS